MTEGLQAGYVEFRPRARLLKLIGAELISDDVLAITELVKNAHDADASSVALEFHGVTRPEGTIIVRDDGHGMDLEVLHGHWMEPAGTLKWRAEGRITRAGRRVLGEKGVGRFAADKLARTLELVSRRNGDAREIRAIFDWDEFDSETRMLSEVKSRWEVRPASELPRHGTILRMTGLRTPWNERMFRRLCTRLARLRSPFRELDSFTIRIDSDEFPQYSGELRSSILDRAPYRIDAIFDGKQTVDINLNNSRSVEHLWNGHGDLKCGPVRVRLFGFDLETESIARIGPRMEVRAWLKEWSGVSVYRDGFRVWPYGEPHDDWLRLDQRRVNNPVVRLSNNQVVGFVEITRDGNPELVDQTNREGLLHSTSFDDLRRLLYFVLQILEAERQSLRHPAPPVRQPKHRERTALEAPMLSQLERLAGIAPAEIASELRRFAVKLGERTAREEAERWRFIEGYSELAAAGQAAIGLSQSVHAAIGRIRAELESIRAALGHRPVHTVTSSLRGLEAAMTMIEKRVSVVTPIEQGTRNRRRAIDVPAELASFRDVVDPLLVAHGIRMRLNTAHKGVLRIEMRPESFYRILHILTTNSLEWLHGVKKPEIQITARALPGHCEVIFSDNGPGIAGGLAEKVFEPLVSGREGGNGMGLTIASNIVALHGGCIKLITDRRRHGANIRILLPRKRPRATMH